MRRLDGTGQPTACGLKRTRKYMAVLEEHGYFWWSDEQILDGHMAPNNAVPGFLTIGDDGMAHLDLHGVLTKAENALSAMFSRASVDEKQIIGILKTSNKHVMLWELARNGSHAASRGISFEGYYAFQTLVGSEPFQKTTNIAFSGAVAGSECNTVIELKREHHAASPRLLASLRPSPRSGI